MAKIKSKELSVTHLKTPIGVLQVAASEDGLVAVVFPSETKRSYDKAKGPAKAQAHLNAAVDALNDYFKGARKDFSDLTLAPVGTDFQMSVWKALLKIPFGQTKSYGDIARAIKNPKGVRAVGLANGKNPIPVIVPCHRVIGSNGTLTGFGGGLPTKKWLLAHEGVETPALL
ncbi:MAG: methylated-DNA--[protein]-cysteine S-methyltransferase [Parvibaculum sp.]|nr:methylated-DNA--[protein]-cysteine S-methyltransferase [Parvibaculum sp.]